MTVVQRSAFNAVVVNQSGDGTQSSITQNGTGNFARANLFFGSIDARNKSRIVQDQANFQMDTRHLADVTVRGLGNESSVSQRGVRHMASVDMVGCGAGIDDAGRRRGNGVSIVQDRTLANSTPQEINGAGHSARVLVGLLQGGGVGTVTSVQQLGEHPNIGNDAVVRQDGQYDRVSVLQSTRFVRVEGGAIANISTRGVSNQVDVRQFGRQFAVVTQGLGRDSRFTASSYDANGSPRAGEVVPLNSPRGSNSIKAAQYGDRNSVDLWQEGTDNAVTIWQKMGSSDNSISINQGQQSFTALEGSACQFRCQFANNSVASVIQAGSFNSASTTQYSVGARASVQQNGTGTSALRNIASIVQAFTAAAEASILQTADVGPSAADGPASGAPATPITSQAVPARPKRAFGRAAVLCPPGSSKGAAASTLSSIRAAPTPRPSCRRSARPTLRPSSPKAARGTSTTSSRTGRASISTCRRPEPTTASRT